jgi:hypothetical protein
MDCILPFLDFFSFSDGKEKFLYKLIELKASMFACYFSFSSSWIFINLSSSAAAVVPAVP